MKTCWLCGYRITPCMAYPGVKYTFQTRRGRTRTVSAHDGCLAKHLEGKAYLRNLAKATRQA